MYDSTTSGIFGLTPNQLFLLLLLFLAVSFICLIITMLCIWFMSSNVAIIRKQIDEVIKAEYVYKIEKKQPYQDPNMITSANAPVTNQDKN